MLISNSLITTNLKQKTQADKQPVFYSQLICFAEMKYPNSNFSRKLV